MDIFSSGGAFGMFCLVSAVCGMLGVGIGRGIVLIWDDLHNETPEPRPIQYLASVSGLIGFLIPTGIAVYNAMSTMH